MLDFDNPGGNPGTGDVAETQNDTTKYAITLVEFKAYENQQFGFDEYPNDIPQFWTEYEKEKIADKDYHINWKSNQSFGLPDKDFTEPVERVEIHISVENPDSINTRLSIESSITGPIAFEPSPSGEDSIKIITLNGQSHENEDRITAWYTKDDGTRVAVGHLNMVSYNKQNIKVVVVPVNKDFKPSHSDLKNFLDLTYKSAITFWDVSVSSQLNVDYEKNDKEGLDTELPDVAAFTKEMRNIRKALKNRKDYDKNNYYIFLIEKSEKGEKNGIMPFNRHFGFIFMENSQQLKANSQKLYHTIAHELAHGAFTLYHTFSTKDKGITQGSTYNLMDYPPAGGQATAKSPNNLLRKYQWYVIHNPRLSLFGGDEEETASQINLSDNDSELYVYIANNEVTTEDGDVDNDNNTKRYYKDDETIVLPVGEWRLFAEKLNVEIFPVDINGVAGQNKSVKTSSLEYLNGTKDGKPVYEKSKLLEQLTRWELQSIDGNALVNINNSKEFKHMFNQAGTYRLKVEFLNINNTMHIDKPLVGEYGMRDGKSIILTLRVVESEPIYFEIKGDPNGEFGFDPPTYQVLINTPDYYEKIKVQNIDYNIPWVTMNSQQTPINLLAKYWINEGKGKHYSISFRCNQLGKIQINGQDEFRIERNNKVLEKKLNNISISLGINNYNTGDGMYVLEVFHIYQPDKKVDGAEKKIGQINVFVKSSVEYRKKKFQLVYIQTNSGNVLDAYAQVKQELETYLNKYSYNQAFVKWKSVPDIKIFNLPPDQIAAMVNPNGELKLTNYINRQGIQLAKKNYEMIDAKLRLYLDDNNIEFNQVDDVFYIYLCDRRVEPKPNGGKILGSGGLGDNDCTIFYDSRNDYPTYVHELGHNFGLEHTFIDQDVPVIVIGAKNSTANYMDYTKKCFMFFKFQWDIINK